MRSSMGRRRIFLKSRYARSPCLSEYYYYALYARAWTRETLVNPVQLTSGHRFEIRKRTERAVECIPTTRSSAAQTYLRSNSSTLRFVAAIRTLSGFGTFWNENRLASQYLLCPAKSSQTVSATM